jgi:hypothetical protein
MYRAAVWYFGALLVLAVVAFWPTYFAAPPFKSDFYHVHFHGVLMFTWVCLLVAQAGLVRAGWRTQHRALGKVSYALVPLIVVSTLLLAHNHATDPTQPDTVYFLYVQLSLMAFFVLCYAWAIRNRGEPLVHARYMIGTALAGIDPMLARVLYLRAHIEPPLLQVITYGFVIAILAVLLLRESGKPAYATAWRRMLVAYVALELPTFFVTQTAAWRSFVAAYAALPLP